MSIDDLTDEEIRGIARYTVQKIENYPKEYGKTVDNYFDLLFPAEACYYLMRREINRLGQLNAECQRVREGAGCNE